MRSSLPVPALLATLLTAAVAWVSTSTAKAVTRPPLGVGLGVAHVRRCGTVLGAGWPDPRTFLGEPPSHQAPRGYPADCRMAEAREFYAASASVLHAPRAPGFFCGYVRRRPLHAGELPDIVSFPTSA